jgi:hypothetical protein
MWAERATPSQSTDRQVGTAPGTVGLNRLERVVRARRIETTGRGTSGKEPLIARDNLHERPRHG